MSWPGKTIRISFFLLLTLVPLIFLPNTSELFEFNKIILTYLLTAVILFAWICAMILEKKLIFKRTLLDIPLAIFLLSQFLSLLLTIDHRTSWLGYYSRFNGGFVSLLCYSLLYWAYVSFMDRRVTKSLLSWSLASAVVISLWGVAEHFGADKSIWVQDVQARVFSTLGQPNWLGAYLIALIFIPLSYLSGGKRSLLIINSLLAGLFFLVLVFTKSRSGFLGFAAGSAVFIPLVLFRFRSDRPRLTRRLLFLVPAYLIFLGLSLVIRNPIQDLVLRNYNPAAAPAEAPGTTSLEVGGTNSNDIRRIVWTGALHIWQAGPKNFWLGTGPETFAMAYYQYRPIEHNQTSEWELLYNKAHNEYLNFLATTGLLGLAAYLLLLTCIAWVMLSLILRQPADQAPLAAALASGWLAILVSNYWGFSVVITNLFTFLFPALVIALASQSVVPAKPDRQLPLSTPKVIGVLFAGLLLLTTGYFILRYWVADTAFASGQKNLRLFSSTQEPQFILKSFDSYSRAYQLNPDAPIASDFAVVTAYMALMSSQTDATASSQLVDVAVSAAQRAITVSPAHPNYYKGYARTMIILSTLDPKYYDYALAALDKATQLAPTDPRIPYTRGLVEVYRKNYPEAVKYFTAALRLKPDYGDALTQMASIATLSATPK